MLPRIESSLIGIHIQFDNQKYDENSDRYCDSCVEQGRFTIVGFVSSTIVPRSFHLHTIFFFYCVTISIRLCFLVYTEKIQLKGVSPPPPTIFGQGETRREREMWKRNCRLSKRFDVPPPQVPLRRRPFFFISLGLFLTRKLTVPHQSSDHSHLHTHIHSSVFFSFVFATKRVSLSKYENDMWSTSIGGSTSGS